MKRLYVQVRFTSESLATDDLYFETSECENTQFSCFLSIEADQNYFSVLYWPKFTLVFNFLPEFEFEITRIIILYNVIQS